MQDSDKSWVWRSWTSKKLLIALGWALSKAHAPSCWITVYSLKWWSNGQWRNQWNNSLLLEGKNSSQSKEEFSQPHFIRMSNQGFNWQHQWSVITKACLYWKAPGLFYENLQKWDCIDSCKSACLKWNVNPQWYQLPKTVFIPKHLQCKLEPKISH